MSTHKIPFGEKITIIIFWVFPLSRTTLQPLYNMTHYNTVLDITQFKDGSQKCIIILKNDHKWSFFNIIYTFLFGYNMVVLTNTVYVMDPNNSVIKRFWCIRSLLSD